MSCSTTPFLVNGRRYSPPDRPVAVICLDGSADEYLDCALARGRMPNLQKMALHGWRGLARAAMPTFTNVNNSSIVTGAPPAVHGIGGNFFFDTASGEEVMMNSASFLRADTIFPHAQRAGRKVAVITAKEKLRDIFASGLIGARRHRLFLGKSARGPRRETHGIEDVEALVGPTPEIYSGTASVYVLQAGVALLRSGQADFLYLSTTDFMQHKVAPEAPEVIEFYGRIDEEIGQLLAIGALVVVTADHGMNAKRKADGSPNVIYLETELTEKFGAGFRVILPITDPYVVHHGALGSFAQVHAPAGADLGAIQRWLLGRQGVTECHDRETAARLMELPPDRMGDLVAVSGRDFVLGRTPDWHDLKAIKDGLRSHGGRYEEIVPLVISERLNPVNATRVAGDVRNFDVVAIACSAS